MAKFVNRQIYFIEKALLVLSVFFLQDTFSSSYMQNIFVPLLLSFLELLRQCLLPRTASKRRQMSLILIPRLPDSVGGGCTP